MHCDKVERYGDQITATNVPLWMPCLILSQPLRLTEILIDLTIYLDVFLHVRVIRTLDWGLGQGQYSAEW